MLHAAVCCDCVPIDGCNQARWHFMPCRACNIADTCFPPGNRLAYCYKPASSDFLTISLVLGVLAFQVMVACLHLLLALHCKSQSNVLTSAPVLFVCRVHGCCQRYCFSWCWDTSQPPGWHTPSTSASCNPKKT
jgi:hypothetical protein